MIAIKQLSRDAQVAALTFFQTGKGNEATFNRKTIAPRTKAALDELVTAGMVKRTTLGNSYIEYFSLSTIGFPMRDLPPVLEHEGWKITL
jgi:hypothetical protein